LCEIVQSSSRVGWKSAEPLFPGKTSQQLFERWTKVLDPGLQKGSWTQQEDETIMSHVATHGCKSWKKLSSLLPGRVGKQCRERWLNHLNPDLSREPWTPEEDYLLMQLHEKHGNHWSRIASMMPSRAHNAIKNRWYSVLTKRTLAKGPVAVGRTKGELSQPTMEEISPSALRENRREFVIPIFNQ
jgi:myb proto-oncogene protein